MGKKKTKEIPSSRLREIFKTKGLREEEIGQAVKDYYSLRENLLGRYDFFKRLNMEKKILALEEDKLIEAVGSRYLDYRECREEVELKYSQSAQNWDTVIDEAVQNLHFESMEAFIDVVEEISGEKPKDGKHLQELTGITSVSEDRLQEILIGGRYRKFLRALGMALEMEAKYEDLLKIKPQEYGLPETWSGTYAGDHYKSILWAIHFSFGIERDVSFNITPRDVAQEIKAPYSVALNAYKLML